jgi:hypothetical protein
MWRRQWSDRGLARLMAISAAALSVASAGVPAARPGSLLRQEASRRVAAGSSLVADALMQDAAVTDEQMRDAVSWLQRYKPEDGADAAFVRQHAEEALKISDRHPWAKDVPSALWHDFVLPYTHFDERPELWRGYFNSKLGPLVSKSHSLREAATAVSDGIWTAFGEPAIHFKSNSTPEVLSPMHDLLVKRYASCTGMSIFLADGLRSVGVPARVVGTTVWNRESGGNHNWVEAWFDGKWNFIDSNPGQTWNEAWFQDDAKKAIAHGIHGIYTPIWNTTQANGDYVIGWRENLTLKALELTDSYKGISASPSGSHELVVH